MSSTTPAKTRQQRPGQITHGAHAALARMQAGQGIDQRTRQGKYYTAALTETLDYVRRQTGREPNLAEAALAEQIAQMATITRLIFEFGCGHDEPVGDSGLIPCLGKNFIAYSNALRRAIVELARMLGSNKQALEGSLAERLAAMARPAKPADQGDVIEAEVVEND